MSDALGVFFTTESGRPWRWGVADCAMALADWAIINGHPDPFADYRGAYLCYRDWKAIVSHSGGMLPLVAERCTRAGFVAAPAPQRGVIGVIGSRSHALRQWGAIFDGTRWRVRSPGHFTTVTARPLGMWSV